MEIPTRWENTLIFKGLAGKMIFYMPCWLGNLFGKIWLAGTEERIFFSQGC